MKIELCAASLEAIRVARELQFDRIELCQALEQGGITPSPGMIDYALACGLETHVLIRPRAGGFIYDEDEIEVIFRDIREAKNLGAHGVVIGILDQSSEIHEVAIEKAVGLAQGMDVTFHRAFDDTISFEKSIDTLVELGVKRILSSGMCTNVEVGLPVLKEMKRYAGARIEIMAGGGVNLSNIQHLMNDLNPDAIHFSATVKHVLDEESYFSESILKVDSKKAARLLEVLRS